MPTTLGSPFTTAVRVVDRVHRGATDVGPTPHPAISSGLADDDIHMIRIADPTDRRSTTGRHPPHFATGQFQLRPSRVTGLELG